MITTAWVILLGGTVFLIIFSWSFSIRAGRYHGVSRFFAFESLLFMFALNLGRPPAISLFPNQMLSWVFLGLSLYLVVHGAFLLVKLGRPEGDLENTSHLVKSGPFNFIRHPMYASLLCLGFGTYLKHITPLASLLVIVNSIASFVSARVEEREMIVRFGQEYRDYMKATKRFLPFVY